MNNNFRRPTCLDRLKNSVILREKLQLLVSKFVRKAYTADATDITNRTIPNKSIAPYSLI